MVVLYCSHPVDSDLSAPYLYHAEPVLQDAAGSGHQAVPAGRLEFWNYVEVFKSGDLWLGFKNSIILVVETVTLEIVLSALAAYGLARSSGRLAESIRNINMGIMMIPSVALLVGTYGLMVKFHMTNTLYGLALLSAAGGIPGTMFMYVNFVVPFPRRWMRLQPLTEPECSGPSRRSSCPS